jgi:hypothetical protein
LWSGKIDALSKQSKELTLALTLTQTLTNQLIVFTPPQEQVRFERDARLLEAESVADLTARLNAADERVQQAESENETLTARLTSAAQEAQVATQALQDQVEELNELVRQAQEQTAQSESEKTQLNLTHAEEMSAMREALSDAQLVEQEVRDKERKEE